MAGTSKAQASKARHLSRASASGREETDRRLIHALDEGANRVRRFFLLRDGNRPEPDEDNG